MAGKEQKYTRIGSKEFVDFSGRELTISNIKEACTGLFASKIGAGMVCDILAGEQGPSCGTVKQIPNTKLIHVRFIDETEGEIEGKCDDSRSDSEDTGDTRTLKRKQGNAASVCKVTQSLPSPSKRAKSRTLNRKLLRRASTYQPYSTWVALL